MSGWLYPFVYMAPTLVAWLTKKSQTPLWIVAAVNLLTGWTIVGWFVAWYLVFRKTMDAIATTAGPSAPPGASSAQTTVPVELKCPACGGTGSERCPACGGNRGTTVTQQTEHGTSQWVQCSTCIGAGSITCRNCNGRGYTGYA